jgi:hypothetical protein
LYFRDSRRCGPTTTKSWEYLWDIWRSPNGNFGAEKKKVDMGGRP